MGERAGGAREIDEDVGCGRGRGGIGADLHAPGARDQLARVVPGERRARDVERGGDRGARIRASRFQQSAAHAAAGARGGEAHGAHLRGAAPAAESVGPPSTRTIFSFSKCTVNLFCSASWPRFSLRK